MRKPQSAQFDFAALATAVLEAQAARGVTLKAIAAEAEVDPSKLTTLTKGTGGLSVDNLLRVCAWLEKPVDFFRVGGAPSWLRDQQAAGRALTPATAGRLAESRARAAEQQRRGAAVAVERLGDDNVAEAAVEAV